VIPERIIFVSRGITVIQDEKHEFRRYKSSKQKTKYLSNEYFLTIRYYLHICGETSVQLGAARSRT